MLGEVAANCHFATVHSSIFDEEGELGAGIDDELAFKERANGAGRTASLGHPYSPLKKTGRVRHQFRGGAKLIGVG